jgi:hypothetical protein
MPITTQPLVLRTDEEVYAFLDEAKTIGRQAQLLLSSVPNVSSDAAEDMLKKMMMVRDTLTDAQLDRLSPRAKTKLMKTVDSYILHIHNFVVDALSDDDTNEPAVVHTGNRGRPCRADIDIKRAIVLHNMGNSWTEVAKVMGTTRQTLYNRFQRLPLGDRPPPRRSTDISDPDLDAQVAIVKINHPNIGAKIVCAHLEGREVHVPRACVLASLRRVDPVGVVQR